MKILDSQIAYRELRQRITSDVEEFWIMGLKPDKSIIECKCLFRGTVDACLVHPRDIFRFACMTNSSGILIAHNHPSQDPVPSPTDVQLTHQVYRAGVLMQIPLFDHIILVDSGYTSFADRGWLKPTYFHRAEDEAPSC